MFSKHIVHTFYLFLCVLTIARLYAQKRNDIGGKQKDKKREHSFLLPSVKEVMSSMTLVVHFIHRDLDPLRPLKSWILKPSRTPCLTFIFEVKFQKQVLQCFLLMFGKLFQYSLLRWAELLSLLNTMCIAHILVKSRFIC